MKKALWISSFLLLATLLCVGTFADSVEYRPSVENKPAPEIVPQEVVIETEDGEEKTVEAIGVIKDKDGNIVDIVNNDTDGGLTVLALSETDNSDFPELAEALKNASRKLKTTGFTGDVCSDLTQAAIDLGIGDSYEDFVVRDLCGVALYGDYLKYVGEDGRFVDPVTGEPLTLDITLDLNLSDDEMTPVVAALYYYEDGEWHLIDPSLIRRNPDNTLTITLDRLCILAFLTAPTNIIVTDPEHFSPKTGIDGSTEAELTSANAVSNTGNTLFTVFASVMTLTAVCAVVYRKNKGNTAQ